MQNDNNRKNKTTDNLDELDGVIMKKLKRIHAFKKITHVKWTFSKRRNNSADDVRYFYHKEPNISK